MPWRNAPIIQPVSPDVTGGWRDAPLVQPRPNGGATSDDPSFADLAIPGTPFNSQDTSGPSLIDQIMGGANYAGNTLEIARENMVGGAANLVGLPVDLVNAAPMLANLVPGVDGIGPISDNPVLGSQNWKDAASLVGLYGTAPEPGDPFQRAVARTGEEIGATAVPAGGIISAAARMGIDNIRKSTNPLVRAFLEPAAVNPARFAGAETGFAVGAGTGASLANELTGNQDRENAMIDAGGAVGGAVATGLGRAGFGMSRDLLAGFTGDPRYASNVVQGNVADAIIQNSDTMSRQIDPSNPGAPLDTQPLADAIMRPSQAEQLVPGFSATTADRAGDTGLAALENARARNNPGPFRAQAGQNAQAVDRAFAGLGPSQPSAAFSDVLAQRRDNLIGTAANTTAAAEDAFTAATADLLPTLTASGRGQQIRNALQDASDAAKEILGEAWRPIDEASSPVDMDILRATFDEAGESVPRALQDRIPAAASVPSSFADAESAAQPLSEVMGIRTALTDELRRDAITPQQVRITEDYIARLDDYLDANIPTELRDQYDAARAATVDFNDRFTRPQTGIAQTLAERQGQPAADASTIPGRFVQNDQGRIGDFEALMREAGSDERVQLAVRDQILHDVRDRGLIDNPARLEQYLDQYGTVFNRFPELREQLGNAANLRRSLDEASAYELDLTRTLTQQGRSTVANYLSFGDERARDAMNGVLRSRDPAASIDELLTFVGDDPQAIEGARSAFWEVLDSRARNANLNSEIGGTNPIVPRKLLNFLDDPANAAVAERLYANNPEHLENIRTLGEALLDVNTGPRIGNAVNPSGTALMQRGDPAVTLAEAGSKLYQVNIGRASPLYVGAYLAGKLARRMVGSQRAGAFERLLDKALADPNVAAQLLRENNPANRAALARNLHTWFGNEASTIANALTEDDEPVEPSEDDMWRDVIMQGAN